MLSKHLSKVDSIRFRDTYFLKELALVLSSTENI